ncbi:GNAT family N-acetyltransferase [Aliikangiella sp. IMCC44359]|uniref:GNAT family N-acetyltransferase n=1 Tax=Aliikangiella sp. IMCC44359 TaxID=3459125 RepID=UPI00403AA58C
MNIVINDNFNSYEPTISQWIENYLNDYIRGHANSYGLEMDRQQIKAHIQKHNLIEQEIIELKAAISADQSFIRCAYVEDKLVGIAYVKIKKDKYIKETLASLSWIYVTQDYRQKHIASVLLQAIYSYLSTKNIHLMEVMVTSSNVAAIRCYAKNKFVKLDNRMMTQF